LIFTMSWCVPSIGKHLQKNEVTGTIFFAAWMAILFPARHLNLE